VWTSRRIARDDRHSRLLVVLWLVVTLLGAAVTSIRSTGRGTPFGDFDKAYYRAGELAFAAPQALYDCRNADGLCFVNLPIVALAFVPVAGLSPSNAHALVVIGSAAALALTVMLVVRLARATGAARLAVITFVLLNGPLHYSLRLGNLTHVVLLFLVAAMLALRTGRPVWSGVLLAACALIKPPLLIWLPYLALRARWRTAAAAMAACLALAFLASVWWFGMPLHEAWLEQYVGGPGARPIGAYNAQSLSGALVRLTTSAHLVDWHGVETSGWMRLAYLGLSAALLGLVTLTLWRRGTPATDADALADHGLVLCTMLLISPISWTHYYCFLIPVLAPAIASRFSSGPRPRIALNDRAIVVAATLVSLPVALWIPGHAVFGPLVARVVLSHYVAGAALLVAALVWGRVQRASVPSSALADRSAESVWTEVETNYR
jgi:hypothetical protein